ncbi:hypothetical protein [Porphyromonas loveana]|uniref:hypothetical protein n=1 Tax=Porphyromonas loveana TaxID=1884669 RepID=UPI0035A13C4D
MDTKKIAKQLAKDAKEKGICKEWHDDLKRLDNKRKMIDMYIRGIDFCLSNEFPSNDYIRDNFKGHMEDQGVFLDDRIDLTNFRRCVALGKTSGNVLVTDYGVCEVFAKHQSKLIINAKGHAFVEIDMFDDSNVTVIASDSARVHVNKYGGHLTTTENGCSRIKTTVKNKKTY